MSFTPISVVYIVCIVSVVRMGSLWANPTFLSIQCTHGIHVLARKAFVFLLDSLDGGTDYNTTDRIRYAYMSGAS